MSEDNGVSTNTMFTPAERPPMRTRSEAIAARKAKEAAAPKPSAEERTLPIPGTAMALATSGRPDVTATTAMVPATSGRPDVEVSAQGLDQVVSNIKAIVVKVGGTMAAGYHAIGVQLLMVEKHGHWIQRCGADSKQAYSSFYQWVQAELGISRDQANDMMAVARLFSAEDVEHYGRTQLTLITRAPKELHAGLLAAVEAGASTRETKKNVAGIKADTGYTRGDDDENLSAPAKERKKKTAKANATKKKLSQERRNEKARAETQAVQQKRAADLESAKSAPQDAITIVKLVRKTRVRMYERPAGSLKNFHPKSQTIAMPGRATAHWIGEKKPVAVVDCVNGVVMNVSLSVGRDGALYVTIDTKRESVLGDDEAPTATGGK